MSDRPYITCRELIDFIADYREGALSPHDAQEFERHLAACPSCVTYLEQYETSVALLELARSDDSAPASMPESLVAAILASTGRGAGGPRRRSQSPQ